MTVADPRGASPLRTKIFLISCSFGENLANSYVGAPSYVESWIRSCMKYYMHTSPYCSSNDLNLITQELNKCFFHLWNKHVPLINSYLIFEKK